MSVVKTEVVVDTNVPVVANRKTDQAGRACESACIHALIQVQAERRTLLDDKQLIFKEYRKRLSHSGQPGLGDAFFKWLWENQANPQHCRIVPVTGHATACSRSSRTPPVSVRLTRTTVSSSPSRWQAKPAHRC